MDPETRIDERQNIDKNDQVQQGKQVIEAQDANEQCGKDKDKKKKDKKKDKKDKKEELNDLQPSQNSGEKVLASQTKTLNEQKGQTEPQIKNNQFPKPDESLQQSQPLQQQEKQAYNDEALKIVQSISEAATQQVSEEEKRIQIAQSQKNTNQNAQKVEEKPLATQSLFNEAKQSQSNAVKKKSSTTNKEGTSKKLNKEKEQLTELQLLLKEKLKEIKTLSSKNSKLQAKYMDLFKENKAVKKESGIIMECLTAIFDGLMENVQFFEAEKINSESLNFMNELSTIVKNPSISKQDLMAKWRQALSIKIGQILQTKQKLYTEKIDHLQKENQKALQEELSKHNSAIQELKKIYSTQQQKLKNSMSQLQTDLQTTKSKHQKQLVLLNQSHNQTINQLKQNLKRQLLQSSSNQIDQLSSIHEQQLKSLYEEIQKCKRKHKQDEETIKQMDQKLDAKNSQVSRLMKEKLKLEHQINQLKVKTFKDELEETEMFQRKQEESINERNQFLKIRQELEGMIEKRDQMKSQISKLQKELQKYKTTIENKDNQIQELLKQLNSLQKERNESFTDPSIKQHHDNGKAKHQEQPQVAQQIEIKSSQQLPPLIQVRKSSRTIQQRQTLQQQREEYLRNVFIRYIKSLLTQNQSSQTLLRVILTILKVPERDKKDLQQMLSSKKKWWIF